MPELPEVETVRRSLEAMLVGRRIAKVRVRRRGVIEGPATGRALLEDARIDRVLRHGKQLAIVSKDGRTVCIHLGMSGQTLIVARGARLPAHNHVEWEVGAGTARSPGGEATMVFADPRRFGGLWTFESVSALMEERWSLLGPDALTVDETTLRGAIGRTTKGLKAALLDQALIAGVGNIYADESLHRARLHPRRPSKSLRDDDWRRLTRSIRQTLASAINAGGSTLRDGRYVDALGASGAFQTRHAVYGRAGEPCVRCEKPLLTAQVAGRTTVWCAACQPSRPPARDQTGLSTRKRLSAQRLPVKTVGVLHNSFTL